MKYLFVIVILGIVLVGCEKEYFILGINFGIFFIFVLKVMFIGIIDNIIIMGVIVIGSDNFFMNGIVDLNSDSDVIWRKNKNWLNKII